MMAIPNIFGTSSPLLANYDYSDVLNATGYETYYLVESEDSTGKDYHLTPTTDYSNSVYIQASTSTSDLDYDLTPNVLPRTLNGTALVSLSCWAAGATTTVFTLELYNWDGSTETKLGSTVTFTPNLTTTPSMLYLRMPITNEVIPTGNILRLRVSMVTAGATATRYGIDPAGRTDSDLTLTTTSKIHIPYRLDL